jgi:hypothetical protein
MITFNVEDGNTVPEIVEHLAEDNYQESGLLQEVLKLDVNIELYISNPAVKVFTVREDEALIGYAVFFVSTHPHFTTTKFAFNDVIYVKPEHRGQSKKFLQFCEEGLDVDVINFSMNYDQPHKGFMQSLGYKPTEVMYHKVIK